MSIFIKSVQVGFNIIGAWPGKKSSSNFNLLLVIFCLSLVFQIWNILEVIHELDLFMNNLGTTIPITSIILKMIVFRLKYGNVKIIVNELLQDWKCKEETIERNVMVANVKLAKRLSNIIALCYNGLVMSYVIIAIQSYNADSYDNRQFVMRATFPIDAKRSPRFEIICVSQFIVAFFGCNGHVVMEALLFVSVLHAKTKAVGVCRHISDYSKICLFGSNRNLVAQAKQKLISKHLNFIYFTKCILDVFAYISFFHLFTMTLINCIVGFMLINLSTMNQNDIFTYLMCTSYMVAALLAVASYCIAGEYLTSQGNLIFDKLYEIPWYDFRPVDAKILIVMIMRSRQPVTITVGSFSDLSLNYFTSIINTSASYLSLVRAASR